VVAPERPLSILFVASDPGRIRYFEGPLELLAERGHRIAVAIERPRERIPGQLDFINALAERHENVTWERAPRRENDGFGEVGRQLRLALDSLHYQRAIYDEFPDFRARAKRDAPSWARALSSVSPVVGARGHQALRACLDHVERSLPSSAAIEVFIAERSPDLVLVTPLVWFGSPQADWVRSAQRLGIRVGGCIFSWDNLTSKGSMREVPDFLTVWNSTQEAEAERLHHVPRGRLVKTGAQNWDHWFDRSSSRDREDFCREVGLSADRPIVLYVESSGYVKGEAAFLRRWVEALRGSPEQGLREAGILVRPHPQTTRDEWDAANVSRLDGVAIWPASGQVPLDEPSRRDFYDSIHHSAAMVGINTSAFIEGAIVGRPCLTLLLDEFRTGQVGTVHFHHLLDENGGPLRAARTLDEHVDQLAAAVSGRWDAAEGAARFVERFVRPAGSEVPATPRFVAAVERACRNPARPRVEPLGGRVVRAALRPVAMTALARSPGSEKVRA
jgi:hypothetical protein